MATQTIRAGAVADIASLTRMQPFLVLAPHPDDETLGCGGLIARGERLGLRPIVAVLTDGAASHAAPGWSGQRLAAERAGEVARAMAELGLPPERLIRLAEPDGKLAVSDFLVERLAEVALGDGVHSVFVTDPADSHPDHAATFRLGVRLLVGGAVKALVTYPVGQRFEGGDVARFERLTLGAELDAKQRAIECHRSQLGGLLPVGTGFELDARQVQIFRQPVELFRPVHGLPACLGPDEPAHFDRLFSKAVDPWHYESSSYEQGRHAATVAAVADRHWPSAWEAGAAAGVLAERLLGHCGRLIATDASAVAVAHAQARLGERAEVCRMRLPEEAPDGPFDLILLSDMLYYLGFAGVAATARLCLDRLSADGRVVVVSWLGDTEAALTGIESAEIFAACAAPLLRCVRRSEYPGFRLEIYERTIR